MSKPRPRPLLIGILIAGVMLVPALAGHGLPTYAAPPTPTPTPPPIPLKEFVFNATEPKSDIIVVSRFNSVTSRTFQFGVKSNDAISSTFEIDIPDLPDGWKFTLDPPSPILAPENDPTRLLSFSLQLIVPARAALGQKKLHVRATHRAIGATFESKDRKEEELTLRLLEDSNAARRGSGCPDEPAPGADFEHALLIRVDIAELHGICSTSEQDWFKFGAVAGKYYTIDATQADLGLDLAIDLFDDEHRQLTSSDDFPFRETPTPTSTPNPPPTATPIPPPPPTPTPDITATPLPDVAPVQLQPRIKSFRAPRTGVYYIRVRDAADVGGSNASYEIIVRSESYGEEPVLVPEICNDRYEPDGIPQNAQVIKSNETQREHRLCPNRDADWVRFFAHAGVTYSIFTNTGPYTTVLQNGQTTTVGSVPGADTVMALFGFEGAGPPLKVSDNLSDSFDSGIQLQTSIPGYYYVQIKNAGDVGDQQIRYDLTLVACLPAPAQCRPTPSGLALTTIGVALAPARSNSSASQQFAAATNDRPTDAFGAASEAGSAFTRVWQRTDRPVAEQRVARSWTWGPAPLRQVDEAYAEGAGGTRQVAYFDKGRMEINNPDGDDHSPWFVTSGLLVVELISGRMQTGDTSAAQQAPADIPIAGDVDDLAGPTYASFGGVTALPADDRSGEIPDQQIARAGQISLYSGPRRPETRLAHFVGETRHNIPQIFWSYLNASGTVYADGGYHSGRLLDWVYLLGYPISEPYWARVRVGGVERDVLIQPFERRVLTYSPDEPAGWQVQMGNVGRHYYQWRYGEPPPAI